MTPRTGAERELEPEGELVGVGNMLSTSPQDPERLNQLTRQVGLRLKRSTAVIADGMTTAIENAIGELMDNDNRRALHASVSNNVEVIIDLLTHTKRATDLPPLPDAFDYAVELAQQNVSAASLRRAYHVGSHHLLAHVFDQVKELDCEPHEKLQLYHHLAGWIYQYVDEVTRLVIAEHEAEVRSSHNRAARRTTSYVNRMMAGENVDADEFERVTGYRLNQVHIGCRVWIDDFLDFPDQTRVLSGLVEQLGRALDVSESPLVILKDRATAEVWFGRGDLRAPVDPSLANPVAATTSGTRIAFGAPSPGPEGFRTTHNQAEQASAVARVSTTDDARVVSYADDGIPVIARLAEDTATTRRWVHEVLGALASDTANAARQRETVRVFLETADNHTETASRLLLHRNSVKYRLTKAESELGRPLGERRLDTQLALATCHVLGSVVHAPDGVTPPD